ncbi:hypothetical protein Peur_012153 [Populus x canadensis]
MASSTIICETQPWKDLKVSKKMLLIFEFLFFFSAKKFVVLYEYLRAGFFIGDGAGVGKGRTIAGLIWENWHHVRRKALWISVGSDLKLFDARRDLDDVTHILNGIVISIGIGGSFPEACLNYSCLRMQSDPEASKCAVERPHLANIDSIDVARNIAGLKPETTLVVVVSKTLTKTKTMLNAQTLRAWISKELGSLALILWYSEFILSALSYSSDFGIIEVLCLGKSLASILLMLLHAGNRLVADLVFAGLLVCCLCLSNMVSQLLGIWCSIICLLIIHLGHYLVRHEFLMCFMRFQLHVDNILTFSFRSAWKVMAMGHLLMVYYFSLRLEKLNLANQEQMAGIAFIN